jgi:uncharacterized membrane protein
MAYFEKSIEVDVPVRVAYDQWTQFESFPQFMEGVKAVEQLDDKRLGWRAEIAGKQKEWTAEITEQLPDERIAWRSTSGARSDGVVTFGPLGPDRTLITLRLEYEPEDAVEKVGDLAGAVSRRVEGDLERFRDFIESRGTPTGAWRGEIRGGEVRTDDR